MLTSLDYSNALLTRLAYSTIAPLKCILNATMLVYGLQSRVHITVPMIELHWLPIHAHILYKTSV